MTNLVFNYGASKAGVEVDQNALKVNLTNRAFNNASEEWPLPPGSYFQKNDFHYWMSDTHIFGVTCVDVRECALDTLSNRLYQEILTRHPEYSLHRVWNFVPQINHIPDGGIENYRAFCLGRASAFEAYTDHTRMPAASAVGTPGHHLTIIFIAGRMRGKHLENPRQTPAYEYPPAYGPKPPSFARATEIRTDAGLQLYISGTASVLHSESVGDSIESQLQTTIENLNVIWEQSSLKSSDGTIEHPRIVTVYIRRPEDFPYIQTICSQAYLTPDDTVFYVQADICRKELLVEIEVAVID